MLRTVPSIVDKVFREILLARKDLWWAFAPDPSPQTFVFVAGMQRSGTNMLMDLLEQSFAADVFHERDPRAFHQYRMRDRAVIRRLADRSAAPLFVIKALCELHELRSLMQMFAPAKTLWIVRDYADAVNSALASFRHFGRQVARIAGNRLVDDWRAGGMSEETHAIVRRLHHPQMSDATAAAVIWYFRNILFFEQGFEHDERVKLISYETLVQEPEREGRQIFDFLGIPFSTRITRKVSRASIRKKPAPEIDSEVSDLCQTLMLRFGHCLTRHR
jgi:hypothetical protein